MDSGVLACPVGGPADADAAPWARGSRSWTGWPGGAFWAVEPLL